MEASWTELATSVFAHSRDSIIVTDARGSILEINEAFTVATGYSRGEVLGKSPRLLHSGHHGLRFYIELWKALRDNGVWRGEMINRRKDGRIATELLTISAVFTAEGQLSRYVGIFVDLAQIKEKQRQMERLAHFDALTGLPNRVLLLDRMRQMLGWARRHHRQVAVCYLDVNGFKDINNCHGHHMGDKVLIEAARRLSSKVRSGDTVARLGSDEFVLLLAEPGTVEDVWGTLERISNHLAKPMHENPSLSISASIGVTIFPTDQGDPEALLQHADEAMCQARNAERESYCVFNAHDGTPARNQRKLLIEVEMGLARNEFCLFYQPKVGLMAQKIAGFEALLRWQHPIRGLLLPEQFQTALDDPELGAKIDRWVLQEALKQMARWLDAGFRASVSVNVSMHLLQDPDLQQAIADSLDEHPDIRPDDLELEIAETTLLGDLPRMRQQIEACGKRGIRFAIDDFGAGYSCLSYLKWLPVGVLKIERSFVAGMVDNSDDHAIVTSILTLAGAFARHVVAKGVGTAAHIRLLSLLGCDMVQGFGIARPMAASQIPSWAGNFSFDDNWLPDLSS